MARKTPLLSILAAGATALLVLAGCTGGPATMAPAYVGEWHLAGPPDPTILTFGEDTFTFTVGDGTRVLQPLVPPEDGMAAPPSVTTMLTVTGSLMVEGGTTFTLTVPEENGVVVKFVDGVDEPTQGLAKLGLTLLLQALGEQPMTVEVDDAGTTMTITSIFFGAFVTPERPFAPLTACKGAPCADV